MALLPQVAPASIQECNVLLPTGLHSPMGALSDDVVLGVSTATGAGGAVLEQGVLSQVFLN